VQILMESSEFLKNGRDLVYGVIAPFRSRTVAADALSSHLDLHAPTLPPVYVGGRGLSNHHEFGADPRLVDYVLPTEAVTVLFLNGSGHEEGVVAFKAQILNDLAGVHHRRHAAPLVAGASAHDDLFILVALVRIDFPEAQVSDAYSVDVGIHRYQSLSGADASQDVAHWIDFDLVEAHGRHFLTNPLDDGLLLTALARYRDHIAQEPGYSLSISFCLSQRFFEREANRDHSSPAAAFTNASALR